MELTIHFPFTAPLQTKISIHPLTQDQYFNQPSEYSEVLGGKLELNDWVREQKQYKLYEGKGGAHRLIIVTSPPLLQESLRNLFTIPDLQAVKNRGSTNQLRSASVVRHVQ